jgi:hypothetical protein
LTYRKAKWHESENKKPVQPQEKKLDSTAIANVEPNALEKLLNEKENNLVTKNLI